MALTQIIQFLREHKGYMSGEEMSRQLNMTRAAIWKHMHHLREMGYEIEAVPHLGYRLTSSPDKLIPNEIQYGLKTKSFGWHLISFESIESTMDEAFRLGMEGLAEGAVICAETQTKGRGRLGRSWISPKGKGLYFSLILRPQLSPTQMSQLTLMAAVALAEAIGEQTKVDVKIKWPNDLLVDGKKIAGILTELRAESDQMKFVVLGVGINVNSTASQLIDTATSLKIEQGQTIDRVQLFQHILLSLEQWYKVIHQGHFDKVLSRWKTLSATLNQRVKVADVAGSIEGMAINIDDDGALLVKKDNGQVVRKLAGDVTLLRSAKKKLS